jgi:hypothetical protein
MRHDAPNPGKILCFKSELPSHLRELHPAAALRASSALQAIPPRTKREKNRARARKKMPPTWGGILKIHTARFG